jgi:hypothetical protein
MNYRRFVDGYAQRLGLTTQVAQFLADELSEEILRQLLLGEDVRLPKLGRFTAVVPRLVGRVSNLPGMQGKLTMPRVCRRLDFKSFQTANDRLSRHSFMSLISGSDVVVSELHQKARKEGTMAKQKKHEHVTVDLPSGVTQITINVGAEQEEKKSRESTSGKKRLLG